ncbi:uncharacterized protein F5Z01DRAFT_495973 [Emericellopsis atlantica]|uniref:Uncharacterized protein n=1 Tax=Emericellopsis atlantica TaxID=2614577 RepID=A0A9P7ZC59_9HYPO|nr:uncharacterized protein F5Z01DRAFT_495973 [Emericellopsis atlantica]KAG9249473.1 hypothetical protein F5Z01DRAFT_495973 [Emericellopsis atlantica]
MSLPVSSPPPQPYPTTQSYFQLATPPATSSPPPGYQPRRDGPLELYLPRPARRSPNLDDQILCAQEVAEDSRIQQKAIRARREDEEHSSIADSETTLWLARNSNDMVGYAYSPTRRRPLHLLSNHFALFCSHKRRLYYP